MFFLGDTITVSKVSTYFNSSFKGAILVCDVLDANGGLYMSCTKKIYPDTSSTANKIQPPARPNCPTQTASCAGNYINYFQFNTIENANSGCGLNGYSDFTSSANRTSLFLGGVYSAKVRIGSSATMDRYIALWIDYNNDGDFSSTDEFLGASFSSDTLVELSNILIKNSENYVGSRRLRVRCRTNAPFVATDACPQAAESGETEDYTVILEQQDALQGPNVITPNNDGKNDFLVFRGVDPKQDNKLVVFDRAGDVKYTKENYQNDWSGIDKKGEALNKGTYYYTFTNGDNTVKGFFELLY